MVDNFPLIALLGLYAQKRFLYKELPNANHP
jgi:hypothetical protein